MVALSLLTGCEEKRPKPAPAPAPKAEGTQPVEGTQPKGPKADSPAKSAGDPAVKALKRELTLLRSATKAQAANKGSWTSSATRSKRQEEMLDIPKRVPNVPWSEPGFVAALTSSGKEHAVTISKVTVAERKSSPPAIPETVTGAYRWSEEALRVVYDVTFRADGFSFDFRKWYAEMAHDMGRLVYITSAAESPGGWDVRAEIYAFAAVKVPRHVVVLDAVEKKLAGLAGSADKARLADCQQLMADIKALAAKAEESLGPLTETHYYSARFDFFRKRTEAVESTSADTLLGKEEKKPKP
ncbi:MAG: hypothetical protein ACI9WU_002095 [Myxococcota bacterium]|jgi:hypothetical protein